MVFQLSDAVLSWAPVVAASAHIFEEFAFPGGFSDWYRRYKPDAAVSFTPAFALGVNALFVLACLALPWLGSSPRGIALWLTLAALLVANACFHILGTIRTHSYSPGIITALVLFIPLAVYGYVHFLQSRQASVGTALSAVLLGGSFNFISAALHRRRARRTAAPG
jgi:hypothetical protein